MAYVPSMPVAAAYFLPVSVLVAVTATPGSGTPPALPTVPAIMVPRIVPPCGAEGDVEACELEADGAADSGAGCAGWAAGADGAPVCVAAGVGVCAPNGTKPVMHTTMYTIQLDLRPQSLTKTSSQNVRNAPIHHVSDSRLAAAVIFRSTSAIALQTAASRRR